MLRATQLAGFGGRRGPSLLLKDILARAGVTPFLALDAGDAASYPGSGQNWFDLSGGGNDFRLGDTTGSDPEDPTFVAAGLRSYFRFDGADFLLLPNASIPAEMDAMHKDNATWTGVCAARFQAGTTFQYVFASGHNPGARFGIDGDEHPVVVVENFNETISLSDAMTATVIAGQDHVYAVSLDEAGGAGASFHDLDGTVETFNGAYSETGTPDIDGEAYIGCRDDQPGGRALFLENDTRLYLLALFDGALGQAQVAAVRTDIARRLGL